MAFSFDGSHRALSVLPTSSEIADFSPARAYDTSIADAGRKMAYAPDATLPVQHISAMTLKNLGLEQMTATNNPVVDEAAQIAPIHKVINNLRSRPCETAATRLNFGSDIFAKSSVEPEQAVFRTNQQAKDGGTLLKPADVSGFMMKPEYRQFALDTVPFNMNHSLDLDSTSITKTAMEGDFKFWSHQLLSKRGPGNEQTEIVRNAYGKEQFRLESNAQGWKVTETNYDTQFGKETLWKSSVRQYSSDGKQSVNYYSNGRQIGSHEEPLSLRRTV